MARRFFYVSLGILCLAIAYNLGARSARADWDSMGFGDVAGSSTHYYWSSGGECYYLTSSGSWIREAHFDLPVSTGEVAVGGDIWGTLPGPKAGAVVTRSGETWIGDGTGWWQAQSFTGSGAPVEKDSWGGVKKR